LCYAFGFKEHFVFVGDGGRTEHAQPADDFDGLQAPSGPADVVVCQSPNLIVRASDEHYRNAVNAGANIFMPLTAEDYCGKHSCCRNPEGYLWSFGRYDPWATAS
jgi:uncharacterized glyoxalase superfamily protein PhnB